VLRENNSDIRPESASHTCTRLEASMQGGDQDDPEESSLVEKENVEIGITDKCQTPKTKAVPNISHAKKESVDWAAGILMRKGNKERRFAMAVQMKNLKPTKS